MSVARSRPNPPAGLGFYGGKFSSFNGGPFVFNVRIQWPIAKWLPSVIEAKTAEHPFQAAKATSSEDAQWILDAPKPYVAKARGSYHGEKQADGTVRRITIREDWEDVLPDGSLFKYRVMLHVHRAKYAQLSDHRRALLATGDSFLYEDSPKDNVWGLWDPFTWTWAGQNLLGKVLMQVREELR